MTKEEYVEATVKANFDWRDEDRFVIEEYNRGTWNREQAEALLRNNLRNYLSQAWDISKKVADEWTEEYLVKENYCRN
jgi:hypothetical protein